MRYRILPVAVVIFVLSVTVQSVEAQYTTYLEILQGSVKCRQGVLGPISGPLLEYYAWLTDPRGTVVQDQSKFTYSARLDGEFTHNPQTSGTYTCRARFTVDGFNFGTRAQSMFINNCGDERGNIIKEYHDYSVSWTPTCSDFRQNVPGMSHYSFGQWNSSPYSWAVLKETVTSNTYCVVANYGSTPSFSSGYRSPAHNSSVGGATNSRHVYGDAVDLHTPAAPNNTMWNTLRHIAKNVGCGVACVEPRNISPAHYHGDYRGVCPSGW